MEKDSAVYITTTIPYVNADPHIGFALEVVQADTLARFYRLQGRDVFFNQGTDEHGQKILEQAGKVGEDVHTYVDRYAQSVKKLKEVLNLSNDAFVRTTDQHHVKAAQELWKRCEAQGDIYKKKYKGLYCVGCEKFLSQRDLVDGKCPLHPGQDPVELEEENYFFALSRYQSYLEDYLNTSEVVVPEYRLQEALLFVKNGLEDFSISREKKRMSWGIPVFGDEEQVMYVWFDALANYISTLGWPEDKEGNYVRFWEKGHTLQMAGKDQVRFQSIMWQAMLKSAGLPATKQVFYHGFITSGGQRMSKSLGNVIDPTMLVNRYGVDATRYLLLRHVHPTDDTDITEERLDEWYNAHLANGLGNLVARVLTLSEKYLPAPIHVSESIKFPQEYEKALTQFEFNEALNLVWLRISSADERITKSKPFNLVKEDPEQAREILRELLTEVYAIAHMLSPFLPRTSEVVKSAVRQNKRPDTLFPRNDVCT